MAFFMQTLPFSFQVTRVHRLARSQVAILDGAIIQGIVRIGQCLALTPAATEGIAVRGVVLPLAKEGISLTVYIRHPLLEQLVAGSVLHACAEG